jgi:beta-lactamase class A
VNNATLEKELAPIINSIDGKKGIYAAHSSQGEVYSLDSDKTFFLASTYKIPIVIHFLRQVDAGILKLTDRVEIQESDIPPSTPILDHRHFSYPGVALSLLNLLRLSIEYSDNTASDLVLRTSGGIAAVRTFLKDFGFADDISIDLSVAEAFAEESLVVNGPQPDYIKDSGKPRAMIKLLQQLQENKFLTAASTELLLACMRRCKTGNARIRALLPADTIVASKTGTITGYVNDIGIIDLPQGEKLFLAIFIKETSVPNPQAEAVLARIAKTIFDYSLTLRK